MDKLKKSVGTPQNNVLSEQLSDDVNLTENFWVQGNVPDVCVEERYWLHDI